MLTKKDLRDQMRLRLKSQSRMERKKKSRIVGRKLFSLKAFKRASCICFYVSVPVEVDTTSMIDKCLKTGKRVVVPLSDVKTKKIKLYEIKNRWRDLKKGAFGIMEPRPGKTHPANLKEADLVVVPGVVFDKHKNRIGQGQGFYDRFLKRVREGVPKIGLAFSFQVVKKVPTKRYDQKLDFVLTD